MRTSDETITILFLDPASRAWPGEAARQLTFKPLTCHLPCLRHRGRVTGKLNERPRAKGPRPEDEGPLFFAGGPAGAILEISRQRRSSHRGAAQGSYPISIPAPP